MVEWQTVEYTDPSFYDVFWPAQEGKKDNNIGISETTRSDVGSKMRVSGQVDTDLTENISLLFMTQVQYYAGFLPLFPYTLLCNKNFYLKLIYYTYTLYRQHTRSWCFYASCSHFTKILKVEVPCLQLSANWPTHPLNGTFLCVDFTKFTAQLKPKVCTQ
jgi:hypothetical protein